MSLLYTGYRLRTGIYDGETLWSDLKIGQHQQSGVLGNWL